MFAMKFMDGTPVPADYQRMVSNLVRAAAIADPGEEGEIEMANVAHQEKFNE